MEKKLPYISKLLLVLLFITIFLVPLFPTDYLLFLYPSCFTVIFFLAVLSLENHRRIILGVTIILILLIWISIFTDMPYFKTSSRFVQIFFFFYLVAKLIRQIAKTKKVTDEVIIESVTGYLLMGLAFSTMVLLVATFSPDAYNIQKQDTESVKIFDPLKDYFYYAFITFTTTGYGDVVPLKPISKSLAILISVSGQLYVATIIAMLVGKYATAKYE